MIGMRNANSRRQVRSIAIFAVFSMIVFAGASLAAQEERKPWVAPEAARQVKNPFPATSRKFGGGGAALQDELRPLSW